MGVVSRIRNFITKKSSQASTPTATPTSTGTYQGPTRPTTNVQTFRETGVSTPTSSGGGGGSTPSPTPSPTPTPTSSGGGSTQPVAIPEKDIPSKTEGLTEREQSVLIKSEQLRLEAKARGKGFTRLAGERRLGGGSGVAALRRSKRKGFRVRTEVTPEQVAQAGQDGASDLLLGGGVPVGVVRPVEKPKDFLGGLNFDIQKRRGELYQRGTPGIKREVIGLGLGVGYSVVKNVQFAKDFVTKPITTIKDVYAGTKSFVQNPRYYGGQIGKTIRTQPGFSTGVAVAEVGTIYSISKIPKGVAKVGDTVRTRKLTEIIPESVIAPEFPKQKYPAIKKGQTAGELLKEFQPAKQYGVTRLTGFTASPKPFKELVALPGTSELKGVYQAPKVSPAFLRVTSEENKKLFSLNPFETLKPSVMKINPTRFELAKVVKPSQKNLVSTGQVTKQFTSGEHLGKSIVPFVKTEKESIIPMGTELNLVDKRFFFKFEGRKIPIYEFDAVKGGSLVATKEGSLESIELSKAVSSYSRRIKQKGVISSSDIVSIGRYSSPSIAKSSLSSRTSRGGKSSGGSPSSSVSSYIKSSITGSSVSKVPSSSKSPYPYKSSYYPYGSGSSYKPSYYPPSYKPPITPPPYKPKQSKQKQRGGFFNVFGRRFGKFKIIGKSKDPLGAVGIGKKWASSTLGATFYVPKFKGTKVSGFRTKKEEVGFVFIQPSKKRLSARSEVTEIQSYLKNSVKGGKR